MTPALILAFYRRARLAGLSRARARTLALGLLRAALTVTVAVTVVGCAPEPRQGRPTGLQEVCRPNHSGVCEGPPVWIDLDAVRRIQARDTTGGRDLTL